MATDKSFRDYVVGQLIPLDIVTRPMMGEYLMYLDGIHFGGIYDNRVLLKKTTACEEFALSDAIPYDGAKPMFDVSEYIDDADKFKEFATLTAKSLPKKK